VTAALIGAALAAWIVTVDRMRMDAGPGTSRGGFGWYLGVWLTMMAGHRPARLGRGPPRPRPDDAHGAGAHARDADRAGRP